MRICLYTESALPMLGGQELVVDALARQFMAQGHEAVVLAPWPRHRLRTDDASLPYPVVRHHRFISTHRFVDWYRRYLAKVYRKYRFDALHCHSVYPTGYIAARCATTTGVATVITTHSGDVCPSSRLLKKPGVPGRYVLALEHADAVIAISHFAEQRVRQLCPHVRRIERIPNGVDVAQFAEPALRPLWLDPAIRSGEYFLFLGGLKHRKGVDLWLDAFATAAAGDETQLVIGGEGPEESVLKSHAASSRVGSRVQFVGRVEGTAKTWLLQNTLCTVMPSRISEGFPLVLLESYAAGRPVIGTRIPGLAEVIRPDRTGILVPTDSPPELAEALNRAITDRPWTHRLGSEALRLAQGHDWRSVAADHLALFEGLIAARAGTKAAWPPPPGTCRPVAIRPPNNRAESIDWVVGLKQKSPARVA